MCRLYHIGYRNGKTSEKRIPARNEILSTLYRSVHYLKIKSVSVLLVECCERMSVVKRHSGPVYIDRSTIWEASKEKQRRTKTFKNKETAIPPALGTTSVYNIEYFIIGRPPPLQMDRASRKLGYIIIIIIINVLRGTHTTDTDVTAVSSYIRTHGRRDDPRGRCGSGLRF